MSFCGIFTALITPFRDDLSIDEIAFRKLLQAQVKAGVAGVVPCGTTGESPTLSLDEKKRLIDIALEETKGSSLKVIAGTGSNDTQDTVELSAWASSRGVHGVLVVTPYYNKPTQAGLEAHFIAVADAVTCPVMLYHVPGRAGVGITPQLLARLAKHPRITSLKDAGGKVDGTSDFIEAVRTVNPQFCVLSGDDCLFLPMLSVGATGVVSVASHLAPTQLKAMVDAWQNGKTIDAQKLHQSLYPLFCDIFIETNPVPTKTAMASRGLCGATVRPPLAPLQNESRDRLLKTLQRVAP